MVIRMHKPRHFVPFEEQLPDDLRADEPLVPFPMPSRLPTPQTEGLSYPDWLARLGYRERNGREH